MIVFWFCSNNWIFLFVFISSLEVFGLIGDFDYVVGSCVFFKLGL